MPGKHDIRMDEKVMGRRAECFGATAEMLAATGPPEGYRFEGTLTGEYYFEERWPARKWYRMVNLTEKAPDFKDDGIWCDWGEVWLLDDPEQTSPRSPSGAIGDT